jgi:O-antigen/teichoic acid export membrane protein
VSEAALTGSTTDHLLRGSAFLMAATLAASVVGFAFWLVAARLYSPGEIGIASTLISATTLIAYLSLLGLNNSLIRYLPLSKNRDAEVTQAVIVTVVGALLVATAYVVVAPLVAPRLVLLSASVGHSIVFVILTAAAAANLLTDSVFIALRGAKYNLLVDGVVQSLLKVALVAPLVALGAFGLYVAYGLAAVVAVALSVALLCRMMALRPRLGRRRTLRGYLGYSGGTYVSACLNLLPILAIPLIVLNEQGAEAAGYYFVAFQIATLLNSVSFAICESAFAEGAHDAGQLKSVARRSAKLAFTAQTAGALLTAIAAPYLLGFFGSNYSEQATQLLVVLALGSIAVAFNTWTSMLLKLTGNGISWLIGSHFVYAVAIIAGTQALAGRDLVWIAVVWGAGNALCGLIAIIGIGASRRHETHIWESAGA